MPPQFRAQAKAGHTTTHCKVDLTVKFVIGTLSLPQNLLLDLEREQEENDDLLLLDDLKDSYSSLPAKVVRGLRWASENLNFDYLMKTQLRDSVYCTKKNKFPVK